MTLDVKWHPQAFKALENLPKETIKRVLAKFDEVAQTPYRFAERHQGSDLYKVRIGDYRALIEISIADNLILIKVFDKRGRVYNR